MSWGKGNHGFCRFLQGEIDGESLGKGFGKVEIFDSEAKGLRVGEVAFGSVSLPEGVKGGSMLLTATADVGCEVFRSFAYREDLPGGGDF